MTETAVRVERLQEIGRDDAIAESIVQTWGDLTPEDRATWAIKDSERRTADQHGVSHFYDNRTSVENFRLLWDSLHARDGHGWDANPWVAVISFSRETDR